MENSKKQRAKAIAARINRLGPDIEGADPELDLAIKNCLASFTNRDSLNSLDSSIAGKVAKFVDMPFQQFLNDYDLPQPDWKISGITKTESFKPYRQLRQWAELLRGIEPERHAMALKTFELLENFLDRCFAQIPALEPKITFIENELTLGSTNVFRKNERDPDDKKTRLMQNFPSYLQKIGVFHSDRHICELCFRPTMALAKFNEIVDEYPNHYSELIKNVENGIALYIPGHSPTYCEKHRTSRHRRTHEPRRLHFYSAIRIIRDVHNNRPNAPFPTEIRKYAYWLAFLPGQMSNNLERLPDIVKQYHEDYAYRNSSSAQQEIAQILNQLEIESSVKTNWTKKCLGDLPPVCLTDLSDEDRSKIFAEIEK